MTKLYALGASLLILSLAAPALADDAKPAPYKTVAAPAKPAPSPMAHKAKPSDDRVADHEKDDDHKDHKDRDDKHDKERSNDRD